MVRSTFVNLILYKLFALITIYLFVCIHKEVPEPYMDEYFHFHQAANYCSGNYTHWDPSITTPPGLYMITHLLEMMLNSIQILDKTFGACSLGLARFTNVIFMLALPFVFMKYLEKIKKDDEQVSDDKEKRNVSIFVRIMTVKTYFLSDLEKFEDEKSM
ncbi:unnamed protein product [Rotaria magnacalcarata]|uniref:Dol-P-Glc:Glc(2)Man(9)GlcNAc(2)-PP-Dol alpha-1,2-glucosyltransferase n=1 Tax=Rotaria magnacalcarata TaxID=392030 RepID=A0A8S2KEU7_9BILA|nr:unnamed protein product [Rotaria magnacalcarata]